MSNPPNVSGRFHDDRSREELHSTYRKGEREYAEDIVQAVRHPLLVLDQDLRVRLVNKAFCETFQVTPEETTGQLVYHLRNGQWNIPALRRLLEDLLPKQNTLSDYDVEHEFEDIGRCIMRLNARQVDVKQLILLAIEDITERRRAEEALRERSERLARMLNIEGVGVLIFDEAGTLIDANDTFLDMHGYSREDVGTRRLTWRDLTPPEYVEQSEKQLRKLEKTGRIGPYEKEYIRKDGTRSWMLFAGASLGDGTTVEYCIDVSERKQAEAALRESEERFRALVNASSNVVYRMSPDWSVMRELDGQGFIADTKRPTEAWMNEYIHPDDQPEVEEAIEEAIRTKSMFELEHRVRRPDGTLGWTHSRAVPLFDDEGEIVEWFGAASDLTERRWLERQVLSAADEERCRIGQNLHDLLASQLAGTAMVARSLAVKAETDHSVSGEDLRRVADLVNESGKQARALSHSLMPMEVRGEGLAKALRQLVERQETITPGVKCSFELGESVKQGEGVLPVNGDVASCLYRIAHEAVINAVKHARPDAVTIRLEVEDSALLLSVRDDGVGIPTDLEPDDGWGLHLMQYRAELAGARLRVKPAAEGAGTIVTCWLPLQRATQSPE